MTALEESRHWAVICRGCGYKTDIAALGGVRYRAKGGGKSPRIKCPTCQTITRTRVEWQPPE